MSEEMIAIVRRNLLRGLVIPASPLALTVRRSLNERRQRALCRYYMAAEAGGLAVGVHTTQFRIRDPEIGLFRPVLTLAAEEMKRAKTPEDEIFVRIAGICGNTEQAVAEAELAHELGYHAGLLSLEAMHDADEDTLIHHCNTLAEIIPLFGFYLHPVLGGRVLSYRFWRLFAEIENVVAIKIAPFNRYQTLDVVRALVESGREDIALYTGNEDHILLDLLTPFRFMVGRRQVERRIVGGLLGHWAVWTRRSVELLRTCQDVAKRGGAVSVGMLRLANEITDVNSAFFDAANGFAGCRAGLHEVLRRQGLLENIWCLDPNETLSPGQSEEIDRVYAAYPHLSDDTFVEIHRDAWLKS